MRFFSRNESFGIALILALLIGVSLVNFRISERRARDNQRKADIDAIVDGLNAFQNDFGFYPPAADGKIVACKPIKTDVDLSGRPKGARPPEGYEKLLLFASPCEWGKDSLTAISDATPSPYMTKLPIDPHSAMGVAYYYTSNGDIFQLFAALESADEPGFKAAIVARSLACGSRVCNYGRSSADLAPEITIDEHARARLRN